jgi:hypothetical protein
MKSTIFSPSTCVFLISRSAWTLSSEDKGRDVLYDLWDDPPISMVVATALPFELLITLKQLIVCMAILVVFVGISGESSIRIS